MALELTEIPTAIGGVFAALSITAGSGLINEIIKALSGVKGTTEIITDAEGFTVGFKDEDK